MTRSSEPVQRLPRERRREQLLDAATRAFARTGGYARTSLEDVASEAGVTAAIIYRHFPSKAELYAGAVDRACERLYQAATAGTGELNEHSLRRMLEWAVQDPAAFRLLFRYARQEPDFHRVIEEVWASMVAHARPHVASIASSPAWADWGAQMNTTVVIESIMAWLDAGQPDPEEAAERIALTVTGIEHAVRRPASD
jgi:AcrR family transcriptional regulator